MVNTIMADGLGWALDNANVSVRVKPRRPYTPYNIFYLLERELLVQEPNASSNASTKAERVNPEDELELPARYKGIIMTPQWYDPNRKEKRKHRKTHGKISFQELTDQISKNWANIDEESKSYCTTLSEIGRKRYKHNMNRFAASKKILELKHEKSMMLAARNMHGSNPVGSPARTVAQPPPPPTIHAVTPDRSRVKSHQEPKRQPPAVTPPYNPYANRRSVYYPPSPFYGYHASTPPPMPSPPPPMPSHSSHQYRSYAGMPPRPPPSMPPPMPASSSHHHGGYHHQYAHYNSHGNAYHNGYPRHPYGHRAGQNGHEYHSHHERRAPSYGAAAHHLNHHVPPTAYKTDETQIKVEEEHYDDNFCSEFKVPSSDSSQNMAAGAESFIHHDDDTKIYSTMSFDSIKTNQMNFNLSLDNLNGCGESEGNEERIENATNGNFLNVLQEDEESILGLLREDLVPFDTSNPIPFQLSWDQDVKL